MGFFPTQAEAIVCGYFRKYQQLHYKERVPKRNIDPKIIQEYLEKQKKEKLQQKETPKNVPSKKPSEPTSSIKSTETVTKTTDTNNNKQLDSASTVQAKKPVENKPIAISTYNGDKTDLYNWSQGTTDVTIQVQLPEAVSKKMLKIDMTATHLKLQILNKDKPLIDADFCEKIKPW